MSKRTEAAKEAQVNAAVEAARMADELEATMGTAGWQLLEEIMDANRRRAYRMWMQRELPDEFYRAVCSVLDEWFDTSIKGVKDRGKKAREILVRAGFSDD